MSGDSRDYYRSTRNVDRGDRGLPPLREVLGDALVHPLRSGYSFDLDDVDRALPSSKPHERYPSPGGYYPSRGPTLPPIRHVPPRGHSISESSPARSSHSPRRDRAHDTPDPANVYTYSNITNPQPATGPSSYSFNVLRAQQGDLVDVRTPSSRAQGILRPTAIIEDEDESHKRYKCDWPGCDKKYDRPSSLEVHRHTHTGSQPYPCQYPGCPRAFNVKSNMLRHFRSHPQASSSRSSGAQEDEDSQSDPDDDTDKWPTVKPTPSSRYFHNSASSQRPSSSSSVAHAASGSRPTSSPSSSHYHSSSRR